MTTTPDLGDRVSRLVVIGLNCVTALHCLLITWYAFFSYRLYFHSDSAAKSLLAQEIYKTGKFFPPDWNYVNGDLFVVFGHIFIVPLLGIFKNSFPIYAVSSVATAALVMLGTWRVSRLISGSAIVHALTLCLLSGGISVYMAENLYGQGSYGTTYYLACFLLYFSWQSMQPTTSKSIRSHSAVLLISVLVCWANPLRAMIYVLLPLGFALAIHGIVRPKDESRGIIRYLAEIRLAILLGAGLVVGYLLHSYTLARVGNTLEVGEARWLSFDGILINAKGTLQGLLFLLGGLPLAGQALVSASGIYDALRLCAALALIFLLPLLVFRAAVTTAKENAGMRFGASYTLALGGLVLFIQLTTTVPTMSDPLSVSRYLVPPVVFALLIAIASLSDYRLAPLRSATTLIATLVVAFSAYDAYIKETVDTGYRQGMTRQFITAKDRLANFLEANNLRYGYATYWNAGALSILSGEHVRVRQIKIDNGLPMPFRQLASNQWYRASAWEGETFLLLTKDEIAAVDWPALYRYHGEPTRTLDFENMTVIAFSRNIAMNMPGWDASFPIEVFFSVTKSSASQIGNYVPESKNSRSMLVSRTGQSGAVHFGPYVTADPGTYHATFDIDIEGSNQAIVKIDVASAKGGKLHAERELYPNGQANAKRLTFSLNQPTEKIEFRVFATGTGNVRFRGVSLIRETPGVQ